MVSLQLRIGWIEGDLEWGIVMPNLSEDLEGYAIMRQMLKNTRCNQSVTIFNARRET